MTEWIQGLAGRFIVFDGPDGSGKTTQFARFAAYCRQRDLPLCEVREPGGTSIGEQIRAVLLEVANESMSLRCEMLLYMASRAQLIEQTIGPALQRGELVLADRFISSTLAYQGTAGGLSRDEIVAVGRVAVGDRWPDLTVVFDVDEATAGKRLHGEKGVAATLFSDRIERKDNTFHRRVRQGYLDQADAEPDRYLVIDAGRDPDTVFSALLEGLEQRLGK